MILKELAELFLKSLEGRKVRTWKTVESYTTRLSLFVSWAQTQGIRTVGNLNSEALSAYKADLESRLSVNARYVYLASVRHFIDWLYAENYLFVNLGQAIRLPQWERKSRKVFSGKQVDKALEKVKGIGVIQARNKLIVSLALRENFKTSQIWKLSTIDVDLEAKELRLIGQKKFVKVKPETIALMKDYLRQRHHLKPKVDWLFVNQSGERLQAQNMGKVLNYALGGQLPSVEAEAS